MCPAGGGLVTPAACGLSSWAEALVDSGKTQAGEIPATYQPSASLSELIAGCLVG